jgi:type IV pilus assembly protein PilC
MDMGLLSPEIPTKTMVPVCRQMATSYDAGIPILRTLEIVAEQQKHAKLRKVLDGMGTSIQSGSTLGEAALAQEVYLPPLFVKLLATGEKGGRLDVMLRDLADYFEDRLEIQRSVRRAMIGPGIRLAAAWFLGTFAIRLLTIVSGSMASSKGEAFNLMAYFREYLVFQAYAMLLLGTVVVGCIVLARMGLFGWISGAVTTHVWPLSLVTRRFALARFFRTMSLLIGGGLRIDQCITESAAVVQNPYIQQDLLLAVPYVENGETLVEAFNHCRYLTTTAREMIVIGEESGSLEESLRKVSEYHLDEADQAVKVATKFATTAIILAVAAVVGYIVIIFFKMYIGMLDSFS